MPTVLMAAGLMTLGYSVANKSSRRRGGVWHVIAVGAALEKKNAAKTVEGLNGSVFCRWFSSLGASDEPSFRRRMRSESEGGVTD